jgi:chromosome segregation ATPase
MDRRVTWLDEQRRKDSQEIGRILEQLEAINQALRSQEQQVQELSSELSRTSAMAVQVRQFEEVVAGHRSEINRQLHDIEEHALAREQNLESIHASEQKQVRESLDALRMQLKRLDEIQEWMDARKHEELRLGRAQDALEIQMEQLSNSLEEAVRPLAALQEGRKQDAQRLGDIEAQALEHEKRAAALGTRIDGTEDQLTKLRTSVSEIERNSIELRQAQSLWSEQQAIKLAEFERSWKAWEKQFAAFETRAQELDKRMENYEETYREMVNLREQLNEVVERLDRRIGEVSELQRLGEERFREEWSTFQADDQKRWSSFRLSAEETWKDHDRLHQKLGSEMQAVQADLEDTMSRLAELGRESRERLVELLAITQDWVTNTTERNADTE